MQRGRERWGTNLGEGLLVGEGGVLGLDDGQLLLHVQLVQGGLLLGGRGLLGGGSLLGGRLLGVFAGHGCRWGLGVVFCVV